MRQPHLNSASPVVPERGCRWTVYASTNIVTLKYQTACPHSEDFRDSASTTYQSLAPDRSFPFTATELGIALPRMPPRQAMDSEVNDHMCQTKYGISSKISVRWDKLVVPLLFLSQGSSKDHGFRLTSCEVRALLWPDRPKRKVRLKIACHLSKSV